MNADIALRAPTSDLAIAPEQTGFTEHQAAMLKQLGVKDATQADLAVFFHQCVRTGLDPFAKQIYMILRKTKEGPKQTIQTGIDGFRLVARRAADRTGDSLAYADPKWCGDDEVWRGIWIKGFPAAAKAVVLRSGEPFPAVAMWNEYVQTDYNGNPNPMWARMPANQLGKCAEAAALRKAFPHDLSGIYIDEEMGRRDVVDAPVERVKPGAKLRAAAGLPADEIHDADVIEPGERMITRDQMKHLHALLGDLGLGHKEDREAGLELLGDILGIDLASTKDLSVEQAGVLITDLKARVEGDGDPDA